MGFTPLEGLVMATRSGTVDPGLVLWLQERQGLSAGEVVRRAGAPLRADRTGRHRGHARGAVPDGQWGRGRRTRPSAVYVYRLRAAIAAMVAAMSGVDAVAFTGGVGEAAPAVREGAVAGLEYLGIAVNPGQNEAARGDANISAPGSPAGVAVVTAREDLEIATQVRTVLTDAAHSPNGRSGGAGDPAPPLLSRKLDYCRCVRAERHREGLLLAAPADGQRDLLARRVRPDGRHQLVGGVDHPVVDLDDHVAGLEPGRRGRSARLDRGDRRAAARASAAVPLVPACTPR